MDTKSLVSKIAEQKGISPMDSFHLFDASVAFVSQRLLSGKEVSIQGFGSFRFRKLTGMPSVFFVSETIGNAKQEDNHPEQDEVSFVFQLLRQVLSEGQTVSIDSLGTFREVAGRVSFIPSPVLRKNGNREEETLQAEEGIKPEVIKGEEETGICEEWETGTEEEEEKEIKTIATPIDDNQREEEKISLSNLPVSTKKKRNIRMIILAQGVLFVVILLLINHRRGVNLTLEEAVLRENHSGISHREAGASSKAENLLELSEIHYGNKAFWVYIYDANRNILTSPLQSTVGLDLEIPDLQAVYGINPNDTMEVKKAEWSGKVILDMMRIKY